MASQAAAVKFTCPNLGYHRLPELKFFGDLSKWKTLDGHSKKDLGLLK